MLEGMVKPMGDNEEAFLVERTSGRKFRLNPEGSTIGRGQGNDVYLQENKLVSRQHAAIKKVGGRWIVEDKNSRYGTSVNGTLVSAPHELSANDEVWFSTASALFVIVNSR